MAAPIGNFRSAPNNQPRKAKLEDDTEKTVAPPVPEEDAAPQETAETVKQEDLTPAEMYLERLKEEGITLDDAMIIYDAVLTKGYFEEYIRIRGENRAVFRTRQYEDSIRVQTALELQRPQLVVNQQEIITHYNLAASLYEWKGKAIPHATEKDFEAALELVRKLPVPLYSMLARELSKFDRKILIVFSEGAAENF